MDEDDRNSGQAFEEDIDTLISGDEEEAEEEECSGSDS